VWPDDGDTWANPDQPDEAVVADAAIKALAHVLEEIRHPTLRTVTRLARRLRS
jgi:hypothetical protein